MIMITVGGQMPFDRLIKAVDQWAAREQNDTLCFAQIGRNGFRPKHMEWVELLPPPQFYDKIKRADLIIGHAGMGTILTALDLGKKLIVVPRRGYLKETRNDHQVATAERLEALGLVYYAEDEKQLLEKMVNTEVIKEHRNKSRFASPELLNTIRTFISNK